MPEPISSGAVTIVAGSVALPALTAFGVPLGLRADVLTAGFAGALVAIALLNAVPAAGDTWRAMVWTAGRRITVACAGSLTAGYLSPLVQLLATLPDSVLLGCAFVVGGGAQQVLRGLIKRFAPTVEVTP